MGLFDKVTKSAGYGGDMICKNCGKKKTLMSTVVCSGTTNKHIWIHQSPVKSEEQSSYLNDSDIGDGKYCKHCNQKKTLLSSYTCPDTTRQHEWVDKSALNSKEEKNKKDSGSGVGGWLLKQAMKGYKK